MIVGRSTMRLWRGCRALWRYALTTWTRDVWLLLALVILLFLYILAMWVCVRFNLITLPPPVHRPAAPERSAWDPLLVVVGFGARGGVAVTGDKGTGTGGSTTASSVAPHRASDRLRDRHAPPPRG